MAGQFLKVHALNEVHDAGLEVIGREPLGAASFVGFEEVETLVVDVGAHPLRVVRSVVVCR